MVNTVEKLRGAYPGKISPRVFATIRKALAQKQDQANRDFFEIQTRLGRWLMRSGKLASGLLVCRNTVTPSG